MNPLTTFSRMNRLHIRLVSFFRGRRVGKDSFGNVYYRGHGRGDSKRERRWVLYKGDSEPSYVPPLWHGWLHHQSDIFPDAETAKSYDWQREHVPNMTGTAFAHKPAGYPDQIGQRPKATGDYEPWKPE